MSETNILEPPVNEVQTKEQEILEQLSQAQEALEARLQPEVITDEQGFGRTEFHIPGTEDVSVVFRDREELPTLETSEGVITAVVSPEERPLHSSGDKYNSWLSVVTDNQPNAHPFERATQEEAKEVRIIANATPYGVVSTSIDLIEHGLIEAEPGKLEELKQLQLKLRDQVYDEEVFQLYDQLYAASAVSINQGEVAHVDSREANDAGLMEVVLALAGDVDAQEVLAGKQAIVDIQDRQEEEKLKLQAGIAEDIDLRKPGEQLTDEELERIAEQHLVAVHTSRTMPEHINGQSDGTSIIRPTFAYGQEHERMPRNTVHWSLNHSVESHLHGSDLGKRPYTIIAPVEGLAQLNGSPAVLQGVDTYFTLDPGSNVQVPETATILETTTQQDVPGIEVTGNVIQLKAEHLTSDDAKEIVGYLLTRYSKQLELPSEVQESDLYATRLEYLTKILLASSELRGVVYDISTSGQQEGGEQSTAEQALYRLLNDTLVASGKYPDITNFDNIPERDALGREELIRLAIERLYTEDGLIEQYPELHGTLTEAMRQTIVNLEILRMKGEIVTSDGESVYINTPGFDTRVQALAQSLGIRIGHHQAQPEKGLEDIYGTTMTKASSAAPNLTTVNGGEAGGQTEQTTFDWEVYSRDGRQIWSYLTKAPVQSRRMAIAMGIPTHARPPVRKAYTLDGVDVEGD